MGPDGQINLVGRIAVSLRRERQHAGLSLTELARRAGLAKSTLSQLEAGNKSPGVETLWSLATALGVPLSQLIDPPRPVVQLIRRNEGVPTRSEHADYTATLLSSSPAGVRRDLFRIEAEPGRTKTSEPHQAGTLEHVIVVAGRADAGPIDQPVSLECGDYVCYPGDVVHVFTAHAAGTVALFIMEQR